MGRGENTELQLPTDIAYGAARTRFVTCPACQGEQGAECAICQGEPVGMRLADEVELALADGWDAEQIADYLAADRCYKACVDCGKRHWIAAAKRQCTECWRASGGSLSPVGNPMPQEARQFMPLSDKERLLALHNSFTGKVLKQGSAFTEFTGLDDMFGHIRKNRRDELQGDDRQKLIDLGYSPSVFYPDHRYLAAQIGTGDWFFIELGPDAERGGDAEKLLAVHDAVKLGPGECHGACGREYGNHGCPRCRSLRANHPKTLTERNSESAPVNGAVETEVYPCHSCKGSCVEVQCCGKPLSTGECCGNGVPAPCYNCGGSGIEPETVPGGSVDANGDIPF